MIAKSKKQGEWAKLFNVGVYYELDIIRSMLAEYHIPVQMKSRGAGAYTSIAMGFSLTGYDIYVPSNRLAEAKEVLANVQPLDNNELMNTDLDEAVKPSAVNEAEQQDSGEPGGYIIKSRKLFKTLFIFLFVIPGILGFLFVVYEMLKDIFTYIQ